MTKEMLKSSWDSMKSALKEKYSVLTEKDLHLAEGKEEEMYLRLQQKLSKTKTELIKELDSIHSSIKGEENKLKTRHS